MVNIRNNFCKFEKDVFMKVIELENKMSEEEYFLFEEKQELRHELINGNLYEISGVSIFRNDVVLNFYALLRSLIGGSEWKITVESFKIKTVEGDFFYPDISVSYPNVERYYSEKSILIVEVLSDSTRKFDLTDKFIQYQKIDTLQYYLCVEPEQQVVIFYFKQDDGEWMTETFTKDEQVISLPKLNISFTVKDIYTA